jgi:hypothetical protein
MGRPKSRETIVCELLWALGRRHAWSRSVGIEALVRDIAVTDEKRGRTIARDELPAFDSVTYHKGTRKFQLAVPHEDVIRHLREVCEGYSDLRIDATFK